MRRQDLRKNRILSRKGESLAETLVSVLVIALALLLLASMVMASKNLIEKSETTFTDNYTVKNQAEKGNADTAQVTKKADITISGTLKGTVTTNDAGSASASHDNFSYQLKNQKVEVQPVPTETGIYTYEPVK